MSLSKLLLDRLQKFQTNAARLSLNWSSLFHLAPPLPQFVPAPEVSQDTASSLTSFITRRPTDNGASCYFNIWTAPSAVVPSLKISLLSCSHRKTLLFLNVPLLPPSHPRTERARSRRTCVYVRARARVCVCMRVCVNMCVVNKLLLDTT